MTTPSTGNTTFADPAEWAIVFDLLKPGQTVYITATAVMGSSDNGVPFKVGRRSTPKRPQWWVEAITLEPADGRKLPAFAKSKLWKNTRGQISMSKGDMAVFLKEIKL